MSISDSPPRWGIVTGCPRRFSRLGVHSLLEVVEASLRQILVCHGNHSGVLLKGVQQDNEISRSLVEDPIARIRESNP
jgi:hypothetical protein